MYTLIYLCVIIQTLILFDLTLLILHPPYDKHKRDEEV
ncbi:Uncharacterised protein [Streptococcus hyointestinalis]|uniref:Uncharacterized protein n=1 Tax=Streptococcus hyointestinalis TaxID=1337 RepID=A0A380K7A5_9STRE|nr:Uncharacterised protein [Streptococcus hyointestinalis]